MISNDFKTWQLHGYTDAHYNLVFLRVYDWAEEKSRPNSKLFSQHWAPNWASSQSNITLNKLKIVLTLHQISEVIDFERLSFLKYVNMK